MPIRSAVSGRYLYVKCVPDLKPDVHDVQVIVEVVFATIRTGVGAGAMTEKKRVGMYFESHNFF